MSEIAYEFTFFKTHEDGFDILKKAVSSEMSSSEIVQALKLPLLLGKDDAFVDQCELRPNKFTLSLNTSTSTRFNHALVRAFKEFGCEFCHVTVFNSQVGESTDFYLHRGKDVTALECNNLLNRYNPEHSITKSLEPGSQELAIALQNGLDPNTRIDNEPLLVMAFNAENKSAFDALIEAGADVNVLVGGGHSILHEITQSVDKDRDGFLAALVVAGADINATNSQDESFIWCLGNSDANLTNQLLVDGVVYTRPSYAYDSDDPLENFCEAASHGDTEKQASFFQQCATILDRQRDLANLCAQFDYSEGYKKLLDDGYNPFPESTVKEEEPEEESADINNPFAVSQKDDDDEQAVEQLADLETAISQGALNVAQLLLALAEQSKVNYEEEAGYFVYSLAQNPDAQPIIAHIVATYPQTANFEALNEAVEANIVGNTQQLIDSGAPVSEEEEQPLLHQHLDTLTPDMFKLLVANGCDPLQLGYNEDEEDEEGAQSSVIERVMTESTVRQDTKAAFMDWLDNSDASDILYQYANLHMNDKFMARWEVMTTEQRGEIETDTLLYLSVLNNNAKMVRFCLEQGLKANHCHETGASVLELAVLASSHSVASVLLKHGANPNTLFNLEALQAASDAFNETDQSIESSHNDEDEDYDEYDDDCDDEASNKLLKMMGFGDDNTPEFVSQADIAVNNPISLTGSGGTCLMFAASNGDVRTLALLLAAKADSGLTIDSQEDWQAMHFAVVNGHTQCVDMLLRAGASVDGDDSAGNSLVHYAAMRGHSGVLKLLLDAKAPAERRSAGEQQTPLILACVMAFAREDDTTVDQLLAHGVDVNAVDKSKASALTFACTCAKEPLIASLLQAGADVNQVSKAGTTPYDIFKSHDQDAVAFDIEQLKPAGKGVLLKKGLYLTKSIISRVIGAVVLFVLLAKFVSAGLGLIAGSLFLSWPMLSWGIAKTMSRVARKSEDDDDSEKVANFMQIGLNAMVKAQAEASSQEEEDEQIIQSWDDEKKAA